MAFGFDPSIILSATKTHEPTPNETLQTLAQLASSRTNQQQSQAQLADLFRRQQQERTLADIYRANADTPAGLAPALMRGGFGAQAFGAQDQVAQQGMQDAQRKKLFREAQDAERKRVGEVFYGVNSQEKWDAALEQVPEQYRGMIPAKFDPAVAQRLGNLALTAKERADLEDRDVSRTETGRHNRAMEARPAPMLMFGSGGEQYIGNLRQPNAPAVPVKNQEGEQLVKPAAANAEGGLKDWKNFTDAVSTSKGLSKDLQKSINSAEALERLLKLKNGQLAKATPQQMHEAYTALNNLISKGGSQAASQIEALVPETLASKWANIKQTVLNEPQSADAQAFIENVLETAAREADLARDQLRRQQLQAVPNYAHLRGADRKRFDAILTRGGIDPATIDDSGLEASGTQGASAANAWGDADESRLQELERAAARKAGGAK